MNSLTLQKTLGFLGLIPFVIPAICLLLGTGLLQWDPTQVFITYSAVILAFLTGTLWGRSLAVEATEQQRLLLLSSNVLALLAWLCLLLSQLSWALWGLMLGYLAVLLIDLKYNALLSQPYRRLRVQLSSLVLLVHGTLLTVL